MAGGRPEPGQILLVIHDFQARSSDELSLSKGDRVELVERDDDFGDGWYLGKHLANGSTGLFPEVYTKPAPRGSTNYAASATNLRSPPTIVSPATFTPKHMHQDVRTSVPAPEHEKTPQTSRHVSASQVLDTSSSGIHSNITAGRGGGGLVSPSNPRSISLSSVAMLQPQPQDNPVMNETLNVIQEHISDMNAPKNKSAVHRRGTNDSGSDYSSQLNPRMSYVHGEETDEEDNLHSRAEVEAWSPGQVAHFLSSIGVEQKHCDVFREQEVSGDVLLGMDQTSVFLKEFDLGPVGRRLKTWQKIKSLQDEVSGKKTIAPRRSPQPYIGDIDVDQSGRTGTNTTSSILPHIPSHMEQSDATILQSMRPSMQQPLPYPDPTQSTLPPSPGLPTENRHVEHSRRPSAASVRDLYHSRQNSASDFTNFRGSRASMIETPTGDLGHRKQPSFDRSWTMGNRSPSSSQRPLSSVAINGQASNVKEETLASLSISSPTEFDRGYFSGTEVDNKSRNVLRKKAGTHSRNSSYVEDQRARMSVGTARHSRYGSVDSIRHSQISPASQKYYGLSIGPHRTPSTDVIPRPTPPPKDMPSPTVTKLDGFTGSTRPSADSSTNNSPGWLTPSTPAATARIPGLRTTSEAVTDVEKAKLDLASPEMSSAVKSPSRTGSSTTSGGPSFELDSNSAKSPSTIITPGSRTSRKKSKKDTSAYTRGLQKISPQEAMIDCDYSGWMKKKSNSLMTTWKPRLFVLKGRRLAYYYSEHDQEERGLIDISFHKVLTANSDRLTGLHASITGAINSPASPIDAHTPTLAATEASNEPSGKSSDSQMFIFKLIPPRAGLQQAINFTKPAIHYFAVPNIVIGRLWMAALMKATIDRDHSEPIKTTYQQSTISLAKARQMRTRPPALMNLDEKAEEESSQARPTDASGLNIRGITYEREPHENDSGVSGISNPPNSTHHRLSINTNATSLSSMIESEQRQAA